VVLTEEDHAVEADLLTDPASGDATMYNQRYDSIGRKHAQRAKPSKIEGRPAE
jgi:hypothetical protein